jgi:hypothetical protein
MLGEPSAERMDINALCHACKTTILAVFVLSRPNVELIDKLFNAVDADQDGTQFH